MTTKNRNLINLKLYRYIKKFTKKHFTVKELFNDKLILNFETNINNQIDYNRIKKFCYEFDCRFQIITNKKIEIIY